MRIYSFANIAARPFPTIQDLLNPYIFGGVRHLINVSNNEDTSIIGKLDDYGISYVYLPLYEYDELGLTPNVSEMGMENIIKAACLLKEYDGLNEKTIVHCGFGQNRSRVVVEAYYYLKTGEQYEDQYKEHFNHLIYNISIGFLSPDLLKSLDELRDSRYD